MHSPVPPFHADSFLWDHPSYKVASNQLYIYIHIHIYIYICICIKVASYWLVVEQKVGFQHMVVSSNRGTPKSSILVGCSLINPPFLDTPMTLETPIFQPSYDVMMRYFNLLKNFWDPRAVHLLHSAPFFGDCHAHQKTQNSWHSEAENMVQVGIWGFHSHGGTPAAGWFISWKIHLQMDNYGVPLFQETTICHGEEPRKGSTKTTFLWQKRPEKQTCSAGYP